MRSIVLGVLIVASSGLVSAQKSIRQVDFKNFTYPMTGEKFGHDRLQWLDVSAKGSVRLVDGKNGYRDVDGGEGLTLEAVTFADVIGDGHEEAIVVLRWDSGGTQHSNYVYICLLASGSPKVMGYFHTGDRAYSGLYKVYGERGRLVVELNDPKKAMGDCCSSGFVRTRYRWVDGKFKVVGTREYGAIAVEVVPSQ